ncbi:hypothetical protein AB0K92_16115 [Streptomyces sp. NPDC052687]|uniref:hypothetical protein n=1 Tax=Streptomyces sp. NPDC052687 TaxID=3154759 RepID=UPI003432F450
MNPLLTYLQIVALRAKAQLQAFAAQEPVRLRAALTSVVMLFAVYAPGLAQEHTAQMIGGVAAVVLPVLVGESTRRKVTPA